CKASGGPPGGPLPLMINHLRAHNDGAAYYRVKVDGIVHTDAWSDYHWNGFNYVLQTVGTVSVAGQPGYYPVRALSDLFLWMNPSLGDLLSTAGLSNGLHTISGVLVSSSSPAPLTNSPVIVCSPLESPAAERRAPGRRVIHREQCLIARAGWWSGGGRPGGEGRSPSDGFIHRNRSLSARTG